jgi:VanZ family protein
VSHKPARSPSLGFFVNDKLSAPQEKKRIGILCVLAVLALLCATLWPFNPWPANQVTWLPDSDGLHFGREGVVVSKTPFYPPQEMPAGQSCSIELLLRPANFERSDVILSFYLSRNSTHLLILQWRDLLMVTHDSKDAQGQIRHTVIGARHAFQTGKLVMVTMTSGPNGTVLYLNARPAQSSDRLTISLNELAGQLILGTTPVEHRPWMGEIRGLAIYAKQLTPAEVLGHYAVWTAPDPLNHDPLNHDPPNPPDTGAAIARYAFSERSGREVHSAVSSGPTLEIPASFDVPHKAMLRSAFKEFDPSRHYLYDVLENVAGFVPLGAILCVYFSLAHPRSKAVLYSTLIGGSLSLTIEVLQAYIPRRASGMTDIITNTLGALIGAAITNPNLVRKILRTVRVLPNL